MHISEEMLWLYSHDEIEMADQQEVVKHLNGCNVCMEKLMQIENEQKVFQNLDYPIPSLEFATKTSDLILSKVKNRKQYWDVIFKAFLFVAVGLIMIISVEAFNSVEINLTSNNVLIRNILFALPIVLLVFLMQTYERKKAIY